MRSPAAALSLALCLGGCATALESAAERGDAAAVTAELDKKPAIGEKELFSALMSAALNGRAEAIKVLLARGAHPDGADGHGWPLGDAAYRGHVDAVRALLSGGAKVDARSPSQGTALMRAAFNGQGTVAQILLEAGADPNAVDAEGQSSLYWAIKTIPIDGRAGAVRPLLAYGADPHLRNKAGQSPLELAGSHVTGASGEKAALLREAIEAMSGARGGRPETAAEKAALDELVSKSRAKAAQPIPEEARRFKVQAEAAVEKKDFARAAEHYKKALELAPWWPEGWYNRALILGELGHSRSAIDSMRRYLALRPDAPDARAAQDQIYKWEDQ